MNYLGLRLDLFLVFGLLLIVSFFELTVSLVDFDKLFNGLVPGLQAGCLAAGQFRVVVDHHHGCRSMLECVGDLRDEECMPGRARSVEKAVRVFLLRFLAEYNNNFSFYVETCVIVVF